MINISTGDRVSFSLYSGINGIISFSGEVQAKLKHDLASLYPASNLIENHTNIWPMLPADIRETYNNSYTSYEYIALKTDAGEVHFIGVPWIRETTLVTENPKTAQLVISDFTDTDSTRLTKILSQYGYSLSSFKINN